MWLKVSLVEPSHFVKRRPQLACFVDINLARLLRIRLAKLLADAEGVQSRLEDASFAAEVGGATQPERGGEVEFGLVQQRPIRVAGEVEQVVAGPVGLERFGVPRRERGGRGRIVGQGVEIHVLGTLGPRGTDFGGGRSTFDGVAHQFGDGGWFGGPFHAGDGRGRRHGFDGSLGRFDGWRGGDDDRLGFGARFGTDPLGFPVLFFRLFARSLHVGARVSVVDPTHGRDAGQGQQIFFAGGAIDLLVKFGHVHRHVLRDNVLGGGHGRV